MVISEARIRDEIVETGWRLYEGRYIAASDGNVSARLGERLLITPSGACKGFLTAEEIVVTDLQGRKLQGAGEPSSEAPMHVEIYRQRPEVRAVVHAHPPHATGFALAGVALENALLPEVIVDLGCIPLARYATPTTEEMASAIRDLVPDHDALLLANHGALTCGVNLQEAYYKMERLEHYAHICLVARLAGRERVLSETELQKMYAALSLDRKPDCPRPAPKPSAGEKVALDKAAFLEEIARLLEKYG